jgi:hypothetical protein
MAKYDPLQIYLNRSTQYEVVLTFDEVERVLMTPLPSSAAKYPEWWANETNPKTSHVQCKAWVAAGYKAFPDILSGKVLFARVH